jgi:hypothetical protein
MNNFSGYTITTLYSIHVTNQHNSSTSNLLYGGTSQIIMGSSSHRVLASGIDESGLLRWVWTLLVGKNQTKLRVISGYRPNPDSSDRTGSVYSQHECHLQSLHDDHNQTILIVIFVQWLYQPRWRENDAFLTPKAWTSTFPLSSHYSIRQRIYGGDRE